MRPEFLEVLVVQVIRPPRMASRYPLGGTHGPPRNRGRAHEANPGEEPAVGVYRLRRDGDFAVGVILAGVVADLLQTPTGLSPPSPPPPASSSPSACTKLMVERSVARLGQS